MKCGLSQLLLSACFFACFFSVAGISLAQGSPNLMDPSVSPPPNASSTNTGIGQSGSWGTLDQLLTELESEANGQAEDLRKLLEQLAESRTALSESSSLLGQSAAQLTSLREAMLNERDQARKTLMLAIDKGVRAEKSRDRWKIAGIIGIVVAIVESVTIGLMVAFK
jgi:hypothetical protein